MGTSGWEILVTNTFLGLNGDTLAAATDDELFDLVMAVASGQLRDVQDIAGRLASLTSPPRPQQSPVG